MPAKERTSEGKAADVPAAKRVVVYKGAQVWEVRKITAFDWAKVGVEDAPTVTWSADNNFRVPVEDLDFLTEEQFQRFIGDDARLEVKEV